MIEDKEIINSNESTKVEEIKETKKYIFRKLKACDISLMTSLIKKIGINKISRLLKSDDLKSIMSSFKNNKDTETTEENEDTEDNSMMLLGITVVTELVQIIIDGYENYENDLYKLLSNTSNLSLEEVQNLDFDEFFEMLFVFFKKEEFMGFLKRVLKLLNITD